MRFCFKCTRVCFPTLGNSVADDSAVLTLFFRMCVCRNPKTLPCKARRKIHLWGLVIPGVDFIESQKLPAGAQLWLIKFIKADTKHTL